MRIRGVVALGFLTATLMVSLIQGGSASASSTAGFHSAVSLPGAKDGTEPSIAISTDGVRYVSWQAPGDFARSHDGVTFRAMGMPDENAVGDVTNAVDAAGTLFNAQICGDANNVLHTCIYRRDRNGQTWTKTELADMHPGAADRPWIDVYPRKVAGEWNSDETTVFLEYHTFSPDDYTYVTVSRDGGKTFSAPKLLTGDVNPTGSSTCNTVPGGITVDNNTGDAYAIWVSGDNFAQNARTGCNYSQIGPFTKAWVAVSRDKGETWTSYLAWQGNYDPVTNVGDNASKLFPSISVGDDGIVHVLLAVRTNDDPLGFVMSCETGRVSGIACTEEEQPTHLLLTSSPDKGEHWTTPVQINHASGSYFFPWIAAGTGGIVDAIYYKTTSLKPNDINNSWYAAMSQISGAKAVMDGSEAKYLTRPTATETILSPKPVHKAPRGGICSFGLFCAVVPGSNRDLADSLAIALDPAGGANAVWTDDGDRSNKMIRFACQSSGPSAYEGKPALNGCYMQMSAPPKPRVLGGRTDQAAGRLPETGINDGSPLLAWVVALSAAIGAARLRRASR